jgi:hypothetical protein
VQSQSGLASVVYSLVKQAVTGYDKNAAEDVYTSTCVGFRLKLKQRADIEKVLDKMQVSLSEKAVNLVEFEIVDSKDFQRFFKGQSDKLYGPDLTKRYSVSIPVVYEGLKACSIPKRFENGKKKKRYFIEEDVAKLDEYFSNKAAAKTTNAKFVGTSEAGRLLEVSNNRVYQMMELGYLGKPKKVDGKWQIAMKDIHKFKKNTKRFNLVYRRTK